MGFVCTVKLLLISNLSYSYDICIICQLQIRPTPSSFQMIPFSFLMQVWNSYHKTLYYCHLQAKSFYCFMTPHPHPLTHTHHPHYFHTTYSHLNTHTTKHHRNLHTVGYNTSSILSIDLFLRNIPSRLCIRMANMCSHSTSCSADQYLHDSSV